MKNQRSVSIALLLLAFALLGLLLFVSTTSAKVVGTSLPSNYTLSAPADTPTPTPTPTCPPDWRLVDSPNAGTLFSGFQAITTISENNIWAVGYFRDSSRGQSGPNRTLVEHWDGIRWGIVSSPNVGLEDNVLDGITALAVNDVWAVGYAGNQPLIEHWDGMNWHVVPAPNVGTGRSLLNGVEAVSTNDVWAVGYANDQSQTLVTHWNGVEWSVIPSPIVGQSTNVLNGVAAVSANDVWAVGFSGSQTLIERWDGVQWSVVPSPNVGTAANSLSAVAVVSATDAWAVGQYYCPAPGCSQTMAYAHNLTLRWDGVQWNVVPAAQAGGPYEHFLTSVSVISANDVWAAGYFDLGFGIVGQVLHWDGAQWHIAGWYALGDEPYTNTEHIYGVAAITDNNVQVVGTRHAGRHSHDDLTYLMRWDGSQWNQVPTADPIGADPSGGSTLYDIKAISGNNIWAVGFIEDADDYNIPLLEHWDGTTWSVVPDSSIVPGQGQLNGIDAISADDIWAVGSALAANIQTLILHWNGSAWRIVPSPNVDVASNVLTSVSAISTNDVWAVGYTGNPDQHSGQTLIEHWDGSQWSVVPNPRPDGVSSALQHVAAVSAQDVWAVGYAEVDPGGPVQHTLIERWDGSQWSIVPSPNVGSMANRLYGIAVVSPDDVWAVGNSYDGTPDRTLVLHWNGTQWSVIPSPNSVSGSNFLYDIAILSANDVWAVGNSNTFGKTLAIHWDGVQWRIVSTENRSGTSYTYNRFFGVTAVAANDIWAVGDSFVAMAPHHTIVERYQGQRLCQASLAGHVMWQGRPAQPNGLQQLPVTLTLKSGDVEVNYPAQNTDASGAFTVSISGLISGSYSWRVKGPQYLANSGTIALERPNVPTSQRPNVPTTSVEMGLMRTADANDDNCVTVQDFNILKNSFGLSPGDPAYDARADFNGDSSVGVPDFNLLKINYGVCGPGPVYPAR